jgi:glycosyltransferase involved in cell wall biosynthesis
LAALGARTGPLHVAAHPMRTFASAPAPGHGGFALVSGRLAPVNGVEVAMQACHQLGLPLVVAGDGPLRDELAHRATATNAAVSFVGRVETEELARLRAEAAVAIVPSRSAESFGLAAAEALADGLPVAASRIGALPEIVPEVGLAAPGDARALAQALSRVLADRCAAAEEGLARVRAVTAPEVVASSLRLVYDHATA